jgi:hypothetical protein
MIEFALYPRIAKALGFAMQFSEESREYIEEFLKHQGDLDQFDLEYVPVSGWVLHDNVRSTMELVSDGDFVVYFPDHNDVTVYQDLDDLKRDYRLEVQ